MSSKEEQRAGRQLHLLQQWPGACGGCEHQTLARLHHRQLSYGANGHSPYRLKQVLQPKPTGRSAAATRTVYAATIKTTDFMFLH